MSLSWEELHQRYAPPLLSYARSRGVRGAEDLVQDVLLAAVERLPAFQGDQRSLRSWLFAITHNRIADQHRKSYRRREMLVAEHTSTPSKDDTVEDVVIRNDTAGRAMQAFEILTERERQVLEMRIIQEAKPSEVAAALGLSNGNVRVIQARALVKIRKHLESGTAPSAGLLFAFLIYMRTKLPAVDLLSSWIGDLRSQAASGALEIAPASPVGAATISGVSESAAGAAAASSGAAATAIKLSLVVSLATASTVGTGVAVNAIAHPVTNLATSQAKYSGTIISDDPRPLYEESGARPETDETDSDKLNEKTEPEPAELTPVNQDTSTPEYEQPDSDEPTTEGGSAQDEAAEPAPEAAPGPAPEPAPELAPEGGVGSVLEDTVEAVEETVETVVEVVEETVETVAVVVEETVETVAVVVEDVLEPVVTETTEAVVDEVVEPVLEDVTKASEETVGTVRNITDSITSGLGGFLGG